jgi:hypothetical protein
MCSNPDCRRPTAGPQLGDPEGVVDLGVAAHITAAATGGPRFDPALTPEQRRALANAIWLCQDCARLIDADPKQYTLSLLLAWKAAHEAFAASTLSGRFAALDRRHLEQIATATHQMVTVLEQVAPIADAPVQEISLRAFGRLRYEHHRGVYALSLTVVVTNLGSQTMFSDPHVRVGATDTSISDVDLFQDGLWHLNPGPGPFAVPALGELKIRLKIDADSFVDDGNYDGFWLSRIDVLVGEQRYSVETIAYTNQGLCEAAAGKKLRPLQQWICDSCGLPILRSEDGWIEVNQERIKNGPSKYHNFRLVHHARATPRRGSRTCYADGLELTDHLHHVLAEGIQWGLDFLGPGESNGLGAALGVVRDLGEWAIFMRRLWLPFYEQGRHYLERAVEQGHMDASSVYKPDSLELVIEHYVSSDWTPEPPLD